MTRNEYMNTLAKAEKKAQMLETFYDNISDTWGINSEKMARIIARNIEEFKREINDYLYPDDLDTIINYHLFRYECELTY